VGFAFYYYVTRDPEVLEDILRVKEYIFRTYLRPNLDLLAWVRADPPSRKECDELDQNHREVDREELVAQLDQASAYMVLLTPLLPEPIRAEWKQDLIWLAHTLISHFYSPASHVFWGSISAGEPNKLGTWHTDFGHTIKAMWMIYLIGKMTDDHELQQFALNEAPRVLADAYVASNGSWASGWKADGTLDKDKVWWTYAELDQMTATLALGNNAYREELRHTYDYWFKYMVDHKYHEVWHEVSAESNSPNMSIPKQHQWKNGYHTFEHALVGYITAQALRGEPVVLHYALRENIRNPILQPYFFRGHVTGEVMRQSILKGHQHLTVTFSDVR
jgi:hypothetical protein